jgi:hypothetical protein
MADSTPAQVGCSRYKERLELELDIAFAVERRLCGLLLVKDATTGSFSVRIGRMRHPNVAPDSAMCARTSRGDHPSAGDGDVHSANARANASGTSAKPSISGDGFSAFDVADRAIGVDSVHAANSKR